MMTDVTWAYFGDHFATHTNHYIVHLVLHVYYTIIKKIIINKIPGSHVIQFLA